MAWWRGFSARRAELDEEIEAHRRMAIADRVARGESVEHARAEVEREMGNVALAKDVTRQFWGWLWLEHWARDASWAFRQMRRNPGFAAVVIATMALGIGAATAIFTLVWSTLVRPLPYPEAQQIVAIHDVRIQGQSTGGLVSMPRFYDLQARNHSFASLTFFYFDQGTLASGTALPVAVRKVRTTADFWKVFAVRPLLGRTYDARDDQPGGPGTVVLSYGAWQRIFGGDPGIVNRQIAVDGFTVTVVGVMPQGFDAPSGTDVWHCAQFDPADWTKYRGEGTRFINVFARLRPGVTLPMAQADLQRIGEQLRREHPDTDGVWQFQAESLRDNRYGEMRPALLVLLAASALLLLIACLNVANLLLSRATVRQREVAVRRALGASAARMTAQFLTESLVLGLLGGAAGVAAAWSLVRAVAAKLPGRLGVPGTVAVSWQVLGIALLVAAATGIAFGLAPALENRRIGLNTAMKQGESRIGGSGHRLRSALVAVQVGLSLILLVGASLLADSLWHLVRNPLGFSPEHLLTFSVKLPWNTRPPQTRNFYRDVEQRLQALPQVVAVGEIEAPPTVDWHLRSNFDADWLPRIPNKPAINAEDRNISGNLLQAMGVPLLAGRPFDPQDSRAANSPVLVNEELVRRFLPGGNPLGRHLLVAGTPHEIVGVIANLRGTAGSVASPPGPEVYWPADQKDSGATGRYFVLRTRTDPEQLVPAARAAVHAVDPTQAIGSVATMDQLLDKAVAQPRLNITVVASFAGIALVLACVGIYGVVAFWVAQRTQEIGVRMALGATRGTIALLFVRRGLVPAAAGMVAGAGVALALTRLLRSQLYGVQPADPWVYLLATAALLVSVLLATLVPARRAASVNPIEALRAE
jgi:putative ABC transport system permease protein